MKMYSAKLAGLAVVIGSILAIPAASAAEPVDISSNITIKSADSCELKVAPSSNSVAMNYTVTQADVDAGTAGTYTLGGNGTADYVISAGSNDCTFGTLDVQMPVVGAASGTFAVALYNGDTKFLVNTFVADLYSTAEIDGSGVPVEIVGAGINRNAGTVQRAFTRNASGYAQSLVTYDTYALSSDAAAAASGKRQAVLSAQQNISVTSPYRTSATNGWPGGYDEKFNGNYLITGWMNGAPGGAHVVVPAGSLADDQHSVTIKVGTAVSAFPYTQQVEDVGGVVNGEVFTGTGTLTVTSS